MLYDASGLVYDYNVSAATVVTLWLWVAVALGAAIVVVATLSGCCAVHVVLVAVASATGCRLGVGLASIVVAALCETSCGAEHQHCHEGKNCILHNAYRFVSRGSVNVSGAKIGVKKEPRTGEKPMAAGIFPISGGFPSGEHQCPNLS